MRTDINLENSLIVGIDVHKKQHTAVVINPYFQTLSKHVFSNKETDLYNFCKELSTLSKNKDLLIGLEDVNGNGYLLSNYLCQNNYTIFNVPSTYTDRSRSLSTHCDKNDILDARRVAEVLLRAGTL